MKFTSCYVFVAAALVNQGFERVEGFVPKATVVIRPTQRVSPVVAFLETEEKTGDSNAQEIAMTNNEGGPDPTPDEEDPKPLLPENALVILTAILGTAAVATQAGAYADFFSSLSTMKENIADPADFGPALNFWIFFAVGHAILQPIFWISEVLHASPGPMIANLVPITFVLGNVVAIAAFALSKQVRKYKMRKLCFASTL